MRTEFFNGQEKVDKEFDFDGKEYWYVAEVWYSGSYTPAILHPADNACPAEFNLEISYIFIEEVTEYLGGQKERQLKVGSLDKKLELAIKQDASEIVETRVHERGE